MSAGGQAADLAALAQEIEGCRRCPRLVGVARAGRARAPGGVRPSRLRGHPVPGFGDPAASILVLGLAPAAHGGNRHGADLHRATARATSSSRRCSGRASRTSPPSARRDDGLRLHGVVRGGRGPLRPPATARRPPSATPACRGAYRELAPAARGPRDSLPRRVRVGRRSAPARRGWGRRGAGGHGAGRCGGRRETKKTPALRPRRRVPGRARCPCWAASTPASRTRSRASSPSR